MRARKPARTAVTVLVGVGLKDHQKNVEHVTLERGNPPLHSGDVRLLFPCTVSRSLRPVVTASVMVCVEEVVVGMVVVGGVVGWMGVFGVGGFRSVVTAATC